VNGCQLPFTPQAMLIRARESTRRAISGAESRLNLDATRGQSDKGLAMRARSARFDFNRRSGQ
jgi:hypothetical protein